MKKNTNDRILAVVSLILAIIALAMGFAAYASNLVILPHGESGNDKSFRVVFSSSPIESKGGPINPVKTTGGATGRTATLLESGIAGLHAEFTEPGQSVTYEIYARNVGDYKAYLTNLEFKDVIGEASKKLCTPGTASKASTDAVCQYINVEVTSEQLSIRNNVLSGYPIIEKNTPDVKVSIKIKYEKEDDNTPKPDGSMYVQFGDIVFNFEADVK